jgi:hypothetical protein
VQFRSLAGVEVQFLLPAVLGLRPEPWYYSHVHYDDSCLFGQGGCGLGDFLNRDNAGE